MFLKIILTPFPPEKSTTNQTEKKSPKQPQDCNSLGLRILCCVPCLGKFCNYFEVTAELL